MKNIERFCKETGFRLTEGAIGFGRPCIGIEDPKSDSFVAYAVHNEKWEVVAEHTAEPARSAWGKGQYLAVIIANGGTVEELDAWVGRILEKGYKLQDYDDRTSTALFLGKKSIRLKAVVDP